MQNSKLKADSYYKYPHVSNLVLYLFAIYVLIWYLQVGVRIPKLGAIRIEFIWAIVLSAFALMHTSAENFRNPLTSYLILYFFVIIIQVPLSYNPSYSWNIFVDRIIKFAFMAWFIISFVKGPKGLIIFLGAFMLACMKMGQEGLIGQITGRLVWQNQGVMRLHGSTPIYAHPNSFSGMAVGTLPFVIAFFPIVNKWVKIFLGIQIVFAVNIILFTGSRTGWVATCLLLLSVLLKSRHKLKAIILIALLSFIAIQYTPAEYAQRFESIFTLKEAEGNSTETRLQILADAWEIFLENPFGVGVGAFPFIREAKFGRIQDTHNLYLEVMTNIGIQGGIVFFLLIFKELVLLRRLENYFEDKINGLVKNQTDQMKFDPVIEKETRNLKYFRAAAQAIFYFILVRLFLGLFGMDLYEIYWWFATGLTIAINNIKMRLEKEY